MKQSFLKQLLVLVLIFALTLINAGTAFASSNQYKKLEGKEKFFDSDTPLLAAG